MSNFSHLFDCDERDTHVPVPTDDIALRECSLIESLKSIATYQMDDYFMNLHNLNELIETRNMIQILYSSEDTNNNL